MTTAELIGRRTLWGMDSGELAVLAAIIAGVILRAGALDRLRAAMWRERPTDTVEGSHWRPAGPSLAWRLGAAWGRLRRRLRA